MVVDVVGYYDTRRGDGFTSLTPARLLDSRRPPARSARFSTPWGPNDVREATVSGTAGMPLGADAVVLNVTVTGTTGHGFLTIWPAGRRSRGRPA